MAQIIAHHRYPERSTGKGEAMGTTMNLNIKYDYDNMLDSYSDDYNYNQAYAVAQLMVACGFSVGMDYSLGFSGATITNALNALRTNFGYSKAECHDSERFSREEWEDMLYDNLKEGYPVYYSGSGRSGGHAFLIDGYKDDYFHFNWGWAGSYDGYFLIDYLLPPAADFNRRQSAIVNIVPDKDDYSYSVPVYLYVSDITKSGNKGINVSFWNSVNGNLVCDAGLIYENVDDTDDRVSVTKYRGIELKPTYGVRDIEFEVSANDLRGHKVKDAVYRVIPAFATDGEGLTPMRHDAENTPGYAYLEFDEWGNGSVVIPDMKFPSVELDNVPSVTYTANPLNENTLALNLSGIISNGDKENEINHVLRPVLLQAGDDDSYQIVAEGKTYRFWMYPGESREFDLTTDLVFKKGMEHVPGNYVLAILADNGNKLLSDLHSIEVKEYPGAGVLKVNSFKPSANVGDVVPVDDMSFDIEVECNEGLYNRTLMACLWLWNSDSYNFENADDKGVQVCLFPGDTYHWHVTFTSDMARPGIRYVAQLYTTSGGIADKEIWGTIGEASAIDDVLSDGNADGVDPELPVYDLTGRMVAGRYGEAQLAPGIYVVGNRKIAVR